MFFHPQPPESGLLESGVGNLDLEDRNFQTDLLSVPFGECRKPRGLRLEFLRSFLCFLSVELTLNNNEARHLQKRQVRINEREANFRADGDLNRKERGKLYKMQKNQSRKIYNQKHNRHKFK